MADEPTNIVLDLLRSLRDDIAKLGMRVDIVASELRAVKGHVGALVQNDLARDERFAAIEVRLDRIERRLELAG